MTLSKALSRYLAIPVVFALGACALMPSARADEAAREWLSWMNEALAGRTYQGEFLHLANGHVERMRVAHRVRDGVVLEHLLSLNGGGREIVRNGTELQCILPRERKVLVETRAEPGTLLGTLPAFGDDLEASYRLQLVGRERSSIGREAMLLAITPRDGYRFGYRVWIDVESHVPVRTELVGSHGVVMEEVLFTALQVDGPVADSAFRSSVDTSGFLWVRQGGGTSQQPAAKQSWQPSRLPPGFKVTSSGQQQAPDGGEAVTHLVISDGLAVVSVFVEGPPAPPRQLMDGQGRLGAAFIYSRVMAGHQVTAVGEVPPRTVEVVVSGMQPPVAAAPEALGAPVGPPP